MVTKRLSAVFVVALACSLLAGCGGDGAVATTTAAPSTTAPTTTAAPTTTTTTAPTTSTSPVPLMCEVAGLGGIADGGYGQMVWAGLGLARDGLGAQVAFVEAAEAADYGPAIDQFVAEGCDLIVTAGTAMAADTARAACEHPEQRFAIVGEAPLAGIGSPWSGEGGAFLCDFANVRGLTFATEEAAFLAGYLAAGMSDSGVVGTFGGSDTPAVNALMEAFGRGVLHYNTVEVARVEVLGWDPDDPGAWLFSAQDTSDEADSLVERLAGDDADIILPVVGVDSTSGAAAAALREDVVLVGLGLDQYLVLADFAEVWLTSLLENADMAVLDTVTRVVEGGSFGEAYLGNLANRGVGLAPYHDFEEDVPAELADAVDLLRTDIASAGGLAAFLAAQGG